MKPSSYVLGRVVASAMLVLLLAGSTVTWAHGSLNVVCLSGVEVFLGTESNGGAKGVTFAGTDNPLLEPCQWTTNGLGGSWIASIDRTGPAGLGHQVSVQGGRWLWEQDDGTLHRGKVTGGWVMWPSNLSEDIGCGQGVAKFSITLSVVGHPLGGAFEGCLDDTHLPFVFPFRIWGKLSISSP